jgi:hypothetical protein
MKISMVVTVDVDPEDWDTEYHSGTSRDEIRSDVVQYVTTALNAMVGPADTCGVKALSVRTNGKESR